MASKITFLVKILITIKCIDTHSSSAVVSVMREGMLGCVFDTTPQQNLWPGYTIIFQAAITQAKIWEE